MLPGDTTTITTAVRSTLARPRTHECRRLPRSARPHFRLKMVLVSWRRSSQAKAVHRGRSEGQQVDGSSRGDLPISFTAKRSPNATTPDREANFQGRRRYWRWGIRAARSCDIDLSRAAGNKSQPSVSFLFLSKAPLLRVCALLQTAGVWLVLAGSPASSHTTSASVLRRISDDVLSLFRPHRSSRLVRACNELSMGTGSRWPPFPEPQHVPDSSFENRGLFSWQMSPPEESCRK